MTASNIKTPRDLNDDSKSPLNVKSFDVNSSCKKSNVKQNDKKLYEIMLEK